MVEIADIKDRDSLKEWLEDRSREDCVQIAARAALRVLPLFWEWCLTESAQKHSITALPVLRCLLISRVAGKFSDRTIPGTEVAVGAVADVSSKYEDVAHLAAAAAYSAARIASFIKDFERMTAEVAATAARAADNDPAMFDAIRSDCMALAQAEEKLEGLSLWHGVENPFKSQWLAVKESVSDQQDTWSFWTQWYEGILAGKTPNWPLEQKIALIEDEVWGEGPEAVAKEIVKLAEDLRSGTSIELFKATLYDFKFDALRHVMLAVPMPQDWQTLTDPEHLQRFLGDALDLQEDLRDLSQALAAEGTALQGGGGTMVYINKVLDELGNAETVGALRVGKLVEWGHILESIQLREDTQREFAQLSVPFGLAVDKLKDLIRDHFAHTLARTAVLRELRLEPDVDPWAALRLLRAIVSDVRSGVGGELPPLDAADVEVLEDIVDSIDKRIRELSNTTDPDNRASYKREIDFQIAKVGATAGLYREKAGKALGYAGQNADEVLKWEKRGKGLYSILRILREWIENLGG